MCEARLQASPRRVRKPRSGWRDLRVCEARLQASPRGVRNSPPLCKGRGTTKWWKGCKNNPSPPAAELPLHKGFASVRSTLAGVAETGSETAQRLEGCKKNNPSPPAAELPLHKGAFLSIVLLFYFLSSFFSPRSGLSFLKNAEIFIIFFVGARLSLTTPRFGAII